MKVNHYQQSTNPEARGDGVGLHLANGRTILYNVFMSAPLLQTKLYIPPPRAAQVSRSRLIRKLNEGLGRQLTLISAPAGYGKTTLLAEWIAFLRQSPQQVRSAGVPQVAWVSLDGADNDPARFLTYVAAALQSSGTITGQDVLDAMQSPQPIPMEAILIILVNEIAAAVSSAYPQQTVLLVLDDYHVIDAQPVHEIILFLLEHLPPELMQLVIITRADPPLPLARLRVRHQLNELRQSDLRFLPEETADFLDQTMSLKLSRDQVRKLEARTEGWIAGLQLAALSMQGTEDVAAFIAEFGGSHRYVIDYLAEEAFRRQEAGLRDFLCQTAILDRMTAPLCDAVAGRDDSEIYLTRLEQANLFLIPLDDRREWYRYHHLFADFLRKQTEPADQETWHRRAALWYESRRLMANAITHMLAASDTVEAGRLIGLAAEETLRTGQFVTLYQWLGHLPDEVVGSNYQLAIYKAWMLLSMGRAGEVHAYVNAATAAMPDNAPPASRARLMGLQAYQARMQGRGQESIELARKTLELTEEEDTFFRGVMLIHLAEMQHEAKDLDGAVKTLYQTFQLGQHRGVQFASLAAVAHLAYLLILLGRLTEAADLCHLAIEQAVDRFGEPLPSAGIAHIGLGMTYYEANDLAQAEKHLNMGLELSRQLVPLIGISRYGYIWQARLQQALAQEEAALTTIQKAHQVELGIRQFSFAGIFAAAEAGLQLRQGNVDAAASWAAEAGLTLTAPPEYFGGMEYLSFARLLRAQGRLVEAQTLLVDYEQAAVAEKRSGSLITIHILQALVEKELGQGGQALVFLRRALELAEPQSYRRRFLDEGSEVAELLPGVRQVAPQFVDELLALFADPASGRRQPTHAGDQAGATTVASPDLVEPLSEREIEVLRLVANGASNREIAQALYVTVGTIKKHLNNIFGKIDVSNRTQAAARARELGLLR